MAPQVKGWQMSKHRRRSRFFWSGLEAQRREQREDATEEEPQPQPWWLRMNHGSSSTNSITSTWETRSMEEDGGAGSREWLVAGAGTGSDGGGTGGVGGGPNAGGGAKPPQALPKSIGEVRGILEHNRVLIQEISQNQETRDANGLTRNVSLIRELNTNIARVVDLYGELSSCYAHAVAAKKAAAAAGAAAAAAGDKGAPKRPRSSGARQQQ
ncbi:hypothetical protein GQ55_2G245900 [Panicum hallii var. hallii]|uniref:Protein EARLY FLOWERING 4 domain-containing protein n=1 Tax=Panicum hallii var. hallii TaxID=1504633 RepID=A0A2T7ERZ8_9POAL|nr:hypothetical protein GQ55_2G245900 [Panicum hallii var. hallii]